MAAVVYMLLTIQEVSEITRIPVATLRYWRHKGIGPKGARFGGKLMYSRESVDAWIRDAFETGESA
ncbi:helix-turn-helix domain-containing protein [Paenarthrobacter sp. CAP02]|uniref:helix-turn-helix domain-containing protein n=1 Tax=Paenarthrobacter sp. CAP02 TaxID=3158144 RepID=UPI0032DB203E